MPRLTHFLSIPLVTPASRPLLAAKLAAFRADPAVRDAIPPDAIRPLGTLHLTLGVFSFPPAGSAVPEGEEPGPARFARARALLAKLPLQAMWRAAGAATAPGGRVPTEEELRAAPQAGGDDPVRVTLKGLRSMTAAPEAAGVLYVPVEDDEGGRFKSFCEVVRGEFAREGLLVEEERGLLLHATVVNTVYCREKGKGKGRGKGIRGRGGGRVKVDAREVLERWGGEVWLEGGVVEGVGICEMGAKRVEGEKGEGEMKLGESKGGSE
ncbi:hypothetical protein QBC39DRAFT_409798 [Podospora conica]|nr:hypothetical protein QBC39DRAFT_409798 [Schizothecium conicum]